MRHPAIEPLEQCVESTENKVINYTDIPPELASSRKDLINTNSRERGKSFPKEEAECEHYFDISY
jgi:hypothetical protein